MTGPLRALPTEASPWDGALDAFLVEKGDSSSRRTVESYGRMLRPFFADLAKTPERVTPDEYARAIEIWAAGLAQLRASVDDSIDLRKER